MIHETYRGKRLAGRVRARNGESLTAPPFFFGKNLKLFTGSTLKKGTASCVTPIIMILPSKTWMDEGYQLGVLVRLP
jgi:hypothetical protein